MLSFIYNKDLLKKVSLKQIIATVLFSIFLLFIFNVANAQAIIPCNGPDCDFCSLIKLGKNIIDAISLGFAVPILFIMLGYIGYKFFTSIGDSGKIKKTGGVLKKVLFGFVLALASFAIINNVMKDWVGSDWLGSDLIARVCLPTTEYEYTPPSQNPDFTVK